MKNCDEMVNSLLERRDRYAAEQRKKRKRATGTITYLCCVCLVVLMGIGVWQGNWFNATPSLTLDDAIIIGEKDYISPDELEGNSNNSKDSRTSTSDTSSSPIKENDSNDVCDTIGMVVIDGISYIQYSIDENLFADDTCLGDASNFDGTYKNYTDKYDISATLYTTKESRDVVLVKLGNGATIVLGREGELIVNENTYFASQIEADQFMQDVYLGKAKEFEIISVPHRDTIIDSEDEVWTVKNDSSKLLIKKSDGNFVVFCACND